MLKLTGKKIFSNLRSFFVCLSKPVKYSDEILQVCTDLSAEKYALFLEIITRDPSIYTINHIGITHSIRNFMEKSIGLQRDNDDH